MYKLYNRRINPCYSLRYWSKSIYAVQECSVQGDGSAFCPSLKKALSMSMPVSRLCHDEGVSDCSLRLYICMTFIFQ